MIVQKSHSRCHGISKARRRPYNDIIAIADKLEPRVRKRFLDAVRELQKATSLKDIEAAVATGSIDRVVQALATANLADKFRPMLDALQDGYVQAGRSAAQSMPKTGDLTARFDIVNPRAVDFLRRYDFSLITRINAETRNGIREIVRNAFEFGGHPYEQAKYIRNLIGLTPRQARALDNYRYLLTTESRAADQIQRMTDAYYNRLLTSRARMIARTETIRASAAGQEELWQQAADDGLINRAEARKLWIVTPDDRLCEICEGIRDDNEDGVPLGTDFRSSEGPISEPPAHPNCRCAMALDPGT